MVRKVKEIKRVKKVKEVKVISNKESLNKLTRNNNKVKINKERRRKRYQKNVVDPSIGVNN